MKKVFMTMLILTVGGIAHADSSRCERLEYAELKDMTAKELRAEIKKNEDIGTRLLMQQSGLLQQGEFGMADANLSAAVVCADEKERVEKVLAKKRGK